MEIFDCIPIQKILFFILYGVTGVVPLIAALYLLLRRGNAIAPGVTPPVRLRRWTASFFAVTTLAHVWWLLFCIYSGDLHSVAYLVIVMVDCMLLFVTFAGMLLAMLQDRRRPMWPALVTMIPFVALWGAVMAFPSKLFEQITAAYLVLLGLLFTVRMIFAIRQYGRWLNDNYADLENKKVWLCLTVSLVCMLMFILYVFADDMTLIWLVHFVELLLVGLLLWRVETLPLLEQLPVHPQTQQPTASPVTIDLAIELLLQQHCIDTQLYLQRDLTINQLAQALGTNRTYLSQYFSSLDTTYNAYINKLRIDHFCRLYQEEMAANHYPTAQQLFSRCGYRSYSTFSLAFKQRMGQSVASWMRENTK